MTSMSPTLKNRDIVVISPQRWSDLWVSKHWIAHELAKHNRVLFVEPPVWKGGLVKQPWLSRFEWQRYMRPRRQITAGLHVFTPHLPLRILGDHNGTDSVVEQVAAEVQRLQFDHTIVLNFGTNDRFIGRVRDSVAIYYCVDPAFPRPGEENAEKMMCHKSNLIYAVSERYKRHLDEYKASAPIYVIPHGFAVEHARTIQQSGAHRPDDLAQFGRTIVGYVGSIHDSYIDVDLLEYLACARESYDFVLVGPYRNNPLGPDMSAGALRRLRRLKNVHLLGPRHYFDVALYTSHFNAGMVLVNIRQYRDQLHTDRRTHFKWLAYFAVGLPVVAPRLVEAENIHELIYAADNCEDYLTQLDRAVSEPRASPLREQRYQYATQFSSEKVLERILVPVIEYEARRGACGVEEGASVSSHVHHQHGEP